MPFPLGNLPAVNEKAALVGTFGTPSAVNPLVTYTDTRMRPLPKFTNGNNVMVGTDTTITSTAFTTVATMNVTMGHATNVILFATISITDLVGGGNLTVQIFDNGVSISPQNYTITGRTGNDDSQLSIMVASGLLGAGSGHTFTLQGKIANPGEQILIKFWTSFGYVF